MKNFRNSIIASFSFIIFNTGCGNSTDTVDTRNQEPISEQSADRAIYAAGFDKGEVIRQVEFDFSSKGTKAGCIDWDLTVSSTKPMSKVELKRDEKVQKDKLTSVGSGSQQYQLKFRTRSSRDLLSIESVTANTITLAGTATGCDVKDPASARSAISIQVNKAVSSSSDKRNDSLLSQNDLGAQILSSARPR